MDAWSWVLTAVSIPACNPPSFISFILPAGCQDCLQHAIQICDHCVVVKPYHVQPLCLQPCCSRCVILFLKGMAVAIHFHDEPRLMAVKVYDKSADGMLPPEFVTV